MSRALQQLRHRGRILQALTTSDSCLWTASKSGAAAERPDAVRMQQLITLRLFNPGHAAAGDAACHGNCAVMPAPAPHMPTSCDGISSSCGQPLCRGFSTTQYPSGAGPGAAPGSDISDGGKRPCWKCGAAVPRVSFFFCPQCNVIQPAVPTADYFLLLDVAPGFEVDLRRADQSYKALQRRLHPDKYSIAAPEEKAAAEDQSALVSGAYWTLRDPLRRAIYLLERGGKLEAGTGGEGMATLDDPEMLMRIMEVREEIESTQDEAELARLREENDREEAQQLQELSSAFGAGDLDAALELTARLRYTERIREAIEKQAG